MEGNSAFYGYVNAPKIYESCALFLKDKDHSIYQIFVLLIITLEQV